jgi:hypothetical protein
MATGVSYDVSLRFDDLTLELDERARSAGGGARDGRGRNLVRGQLAGIRRGHRLPAGRRTNADFTPDTFADDLFISEYAEGSGSNRYVEIYNGTGAAADLSA